MLVAQDVQSVASIFIPPSANTSGLNNNSGISATISAGLAVTLAGIPYTSVPGNTGFIGILQNDVPPLVQSAQLNSAQFNQQRTTPVATQGRLAIRVFQAFENSLPLGAPIAIYQGEALSIGGGGTTIAATTVNGATIIVLERVLASDGRLYVITHLN